MKKSARFWSARTLSLFDSRISLLFLKTRKFDKTHKNISHSSLCMSFGPTWSKKPNSSAFVFGEEHVKGNDHCSSDLCTRTLRILLDVLYEHDNHFLSSHLNNDVINSRFSDRSFASIIHRFIKNHTLYESNFGTFKAIPTWNRRLRDEQHFVFVFAIAWLPTTAVVPTVLEQYWYGTIF